jgi:hypothetical protein
MQVPALWALELYNLIQACAQFRYANLIVISSYYNPLEGIYLFAAFSRDSTETRIVSIYPLF